MNRYFILFASLLLSACHIKNTTTDIDLFDSDSISKNIPISHKSSISNQAWYHIFNDKDLNTLIQLSLDNNLSVNQAIERLKQSRYSYAIKSNENLPMFDFNAEYEQSKTNKLSNSEYDSNAFKAGFEMSWEIDIWGKGKNISKQYYEFMKNREYTLQNVQISIVAEVANNYINLRNSQEKLRIAKQNLTLQRAILQVVNDKVKTGIEDYLALNQAEYTVNITKSLIPQYVSEIEQYKNSIAVLLGTLPSNLPVNLNNFTNNIVANTFKYNVKNLYNLPLDIIKNRPDIAAAEANVNAQNASIGVAIASLYPTINLSTTFEFVSSSGYSLFNKDSQIYGFTPSLSLPIWHWGQLKNNIELQKHIKEEYVLNYNEMVITAVMEIKNAIVSIEKAYETNSSYKSSLAKMQNIMKLTKNKYDNGLVDFTDLAIAEQNLLKAQNTLSESNAEILRNITYFYKSVGYNVK